MLMFTITFGLIFINLEPLNNAISTFLNHQMYVPHLKTEVCQEQTTDVDCELNSSKTETIKPSSELDLLELDWELDTLNYLLKFGTKTNKGCPKRYSVLLIEPRHEKTCLRGLRPGKTQSSLLSYRD